MTNGSLIEELEALPQERKAMLNRLKRVEGQLRGIQRMIIEDKPCSEILVQLTAARKAMHNACIEILKNYVRRCLVEEGKGETPKKMEDMEKLIRTLLDISPNG